MKILGTDYDGVIINIEPQKAAAFGFLLHRYWGVNKTEATQYWIEGGGTSRRSKFDYFYKKRFNKNLPDQEYDEIEQQFSTLLKEKYYPEVKLLPFAKEFLDYTRSKFDFMFVSSGVPMDEINYLVRLNGLSVYFDAIYGTSKIYLTKRDHFRRVLGGKLPDLFIFIADGVEDIKVAKEFHAASIALTTNRPKDVLKEVGANYLCKNLKESLLIVKNLLKD